MWFKATRDGGFTLLELVLALILLLCLTGAMVFQFSSMSQGAELDEGAARLEGVLNYARAEAASSGRKVRVVFSQSDPQEQQPKELTGVRVFWEPDPIGQPGIYKEMRGPHWIQQTLDTLIGVQSVKLMDGMQALLSGAGDGEAAGNVANAEPSRTASTASSGAQSDPMMGSGMPPVTFYPDGSSDSAEIVISSRDESDKRKVKVSLMGVTGSVKREPMPEETDPTLDDSATSPDLTVPN